MVNTLSSTIKINTFSDSLSSFRKVHFIFMLLFMQLNWITITQNVVEVITIVVVEEVTVEYLKNFRIVCLKYNSQHKYFKFYLIFMKYLEFQ